MWELVEVVSALLTESLGYLAGSRKAYLSQDLNL